MTSRFDMEGFISAVVAEEENRHQLQDDEDYEDVFGKLNTTCEWLPWTSDWMVGGCR